MGVCFEQIPLPPSSSHYGVQTLVAALAGDSAQVVWLIRVRRLGADGARDIRLLVLKAEERESYNRLTMGICR